MKHLAEGRARFTRYDEAVSAVMESGRPSISLIQRALRCGYEEASAYMEKMEYERLVSPMANNGCRTILNRFQEIDRQTQSKPMDGRELFYAVIFRATGNLPQGAPSYLNGPATVQALWPLCERFRPHLAQLKTLAYDPAFETEADEAIEQELLYDKDWSEVSAQAWRVLYERFTQAVIAAEVNHLAGNTQLLPMPQGFPDAARTELAMAFLLYRMKLPYPARSADDFEQFAGRIAASIQQH